MIKTGIILATLLVLGVVVVSQGTVRASEPDRETYPPFYTKGPYYAKVTVRLDTDCWEQVKVRFTPDKHNDVLVNKQYFHNNKPGLTHWTKIQTAMKFGVEKLDNGRLRGYAVVDVNGDSDYQYKTFTNTEYQKQGWIPWSFHLKTDTSKCKTFHVAGS